MNMKYLSKKWPLDLQKSELKIHVLCTNKCDQMYHNRTYQFQYSDDLNDTGCNDTQYVELEHDVLNYYETAHKELYLQETLTENVTESDLAIKETEDNTNQEELKYNENECDKLNHDTIIDNINYDNNRNNSDAKFEIDNGSKDYEESNNCNEFADNLYNNDTLNTVIDKDTVIKKNKVKKDDGYKKIVLSLETQKAELEGNRKKKKYLEAEFKCYSCALGFLFKDTYQAHMMRHEESNGEFQCTTCILRFATVASLRIHTACHSERHKCRQCGACLKPRAKRCHTCFKPTEMRELFKVRGSLKSWTKLWCILKPGLLLLYKSPKAKRSHWVGTVLLTSCRVIERPSKKDGFCFKLYHPLEQSIWAPRGPHNKTIGAVVQPLPTAHLIFRAPSQAAGHCWLVKLSKLSQ